MTLSILICSLHSRREMLKRLVVKLESQTDISCVEIIINADSKQKTTGEKRNELIKVATGKYVAFIDDDDDVPDYYINQMLSAAFSDADCFAINGVMTTDGTNEIAWRISKDYENRTIIENGKQIYLRKTNHITGVKREHAIKAPFPNKSNAEDKGYSDEVVNHLKTEYKIEKPMYHYRFTTKNKEYT